MGRITTLFALSRRGAEAMLKARPCWVSQKAHGIASTADSGMVCSANTNSPEPLRSLRSSRACIYYSRTTWRIVGPVLSTRSSFRPHSRHPAAFISFPKAELRSCAPRSGYERRGLGQSRPSSRPSHSAASEPKAVIAEASCKSWKRTF